MKAFNKCFWSIKSKCYKTLKLDNQNSCLPWVLGLLLWLSWWRIHLQCGRPGFDPWVGKLPWRRERLPTPVFWLGEFHGLYSSWGHRESDTTEQPSLSTSLGIRPTECNSSFMASELSDLGQVAFPVWASNSPPLWEEWQHLPYKGSLEEEMATHSSILAWRIPPTEEPSELYPMGL